MNKKIVDLDELISATFNSHLDALDVLSRRACEGKDRSQIAKCGPISKEYVEKANKARVIYGSQLGARGAYATLGSTDIMDGWTSLRGNFVKFSQKIEAHQKFANENNLSSEDVTRSYEALGAEIASFGASLNQRNPDTKTLVLVRVLDDLRRVSARTAEPLFNFALSDSVPT